ncbi:MAG: protein kinase [Bdellovibrionota bacterium]
MDAETKTITGLILEPGVVIAQRFEICERLGAGGVGMVYRAIDRELDNEVVALKLLLPHLSQDENVFRRFRNEVLVARTLSHPNIVRTHDMGKAEGGYSYISMEYVDGVSLKDKLVKRDPQGLIQPALAFDEVLRILYQIISGVAYAHGKGVIHRDLKPANVLLSTRNEVKLADFGTARMIGMDTSLTQTGQVIGTPDYMSPEQIRGETLDPSCDIYALGIVAYELATGQRPFVADSAVAVAFKHLNDPVPAFASPERGIPLWYEDIVRRATAKKKTDRFASMMEFAATLLDYAPQLSVQSTFFTVDRTVSRAAPVLDSGSSPAINGRSESPVSPGTKMNLGPELKGERKFELGSASVQPEDEGWKLGSSAFDSTEIRQHAADTTPKPSGAGAKLAGLLLGAVCGLLIVLVVAARMSPSVREMLTPTLKSFRSSSPNAADTVAGILGISLEPTVNLPPVEVAVKPDISAEDKRERERYERELGGDKGSDAEPQPSVSSGGADAKPTTAPVKQPTPVVEAKTERVDEKVEPKAEPKTEPKADTKSEPKSEPKDEKTPEVTPTPQAALSFTGSLALRDLNHGPVDESVAVDRLAQTKWSATLGISGGSPAELSQEKVRDEFAVNIFDTRTASVVARLKPDQIQLPGKSETSMLLSGSLAAFKSTNPNAGAYRLDVVRAGEVIASKDLILYKASFSAPVTQYPSDQKVTIVRGTGITGGPDEPKLPVTERPTTGDETIPPAPTSTPVAQMPDTVPRLPTTAGGLPLAKGTTPDSFPERMTPPPVVPVTPPIQEPVVSNQPPAVTENYGGFIRFSSDGGTDDRRAMILNLSFTGVEISGNATVAGYDSFVVTGRVLARGMELELKNGTYWIRLTSGLRDRTLRGIYSFPAVQKRGSWEATRTN